MDRCRLRSVLPSSFYLYYHRCHIESCPVLFCPVLFISQSELPSSLYLFYRRCHIESCSVLFCFVLSFLYQSQSFHPLSTSFIVDVTLRAALFCSVLFCSVLFCSVLFTSKSELPSSLYLFYRRCHIEMHHKDKNFF